MKNNSESLNSERTMSKFAQQEQSANAITCMHLLHYHTWDNHKVGLKVRNKQN